MCGQFAIKPAFQRPIQPVQQNGVQRKRREAAKTRHPVQMRSQPILKISQQAFVIASRPGFSLQPMHQLEASLNIARRLRPGQA